MRLWIDARLEAMRASFFLMPMLAVVAAITAGFVTLAIDRGIDTGTDLPLGLASTVESARSLLSTIASATITFAGIAFSVSLLVIQLASTQYSPRVVHTLFRDSYNKRVMALVMGTFTYCIVVLRSIRSALEESGDPVVPNVSVAIAVVLGIATILGTIAFINHSAHTMDVSEILARVRHDAIEQVEREWELSDGEGTDHDAPPGSPPSTGAPTCTIRFDSSGWVQQIDVETLLGCVPEGGVLRLDTVAGRYAVKGAVLCTLTPPPDDGDVDEVTAQVHKALSLGPTRTMQQDVSYGLRQLVDITLKALSPGINDPTTAQDAIFHTASVLAEMLRRGPAPRHHVGDGGGHVVVEQQLTHAELIALAFDEPRRVAVEHPTVAVYLLETLHLLLEQLVSMDLGERGRPLIEQAGLVVEGCAAADLLPTDLALVQSAYDRRFTPYLAMLGPPSIEV